MTCRVDRLLPNSPPPPPPPLLALWSLRLRLDDAIDDTHAALVVCLSARFEYVYCKCLPHTHTHAKQSRAVLSSRESRGRGGGELFAYAFGHLFIVLSRKKQATTSWRKLFMKRMSSTNLLCSPSPPPPLPSSCPSNNPFSPRRSQVA